MEAERPVTARRPDEVRNERIVLWRDTFDWASGLVNILLAGPIYAFRRVSMTIGVKVAMRKAAKDAARAG